MLEYIKKQLAQRAGVITQEQTAVDPAEVSNELLMEYAPLMKGLDDLSVEGTDTNTERPIIAIPLTGEDDEEVSDLGIEDVTSQVANDPELDTFEVHSDGVPVIPLDANIQETYANMRTEYDFIFEGYEMIDPAEGMTDEEYDKVVQEYAEQKFREYRDEVLFNQAYGFEKRSIFNEFVSGDFFAEFADGRTAILEPNYQVDKFGNVRVKQIESLRVMDAGNHFQSFTPFMEAIQESYGYNKETDGSVWKTLQPMSLNVPIDPIDHHSVIVGFKNMKNNGRMEYVRCSVPVLDAFNKPKLESVSPETIKRMNKVSCTKGYAIQESARIAEEEGAFFMEGIDFGNTGDMAPANEAAAPPAEPTNAPAAAPAETPTETPAADGGNDKVSIPVETNNVSDQIAEKVASDTDVPVESQNGDETAAKIENAGNTADAMPDVPMDDASATPEDPTNPDAEVSADGDVSVGMGAEDPTAAGDFSADAVDPANNGANIDDKLNELDAMGDTANADGMDQMDMGAADPSGDVSNLSMDEIIQQATEKIKSLPLGVLQKFISGDTVALQEAYVMEAFGKKDKKGGPTLNAEVDLGLRECLGILNDDQLSFKQIESKFKASGKKLNKTLTTAAKSKDVYSAEEKKELSDLNESLTDLMVHFKPSSKDKVEETKKKIMTFTNNAKQADKIIQRHKGVSDEADDVKVEEKGKE